MHTVEAMWAPSLVIALAYLSIVATAAIGAALRVGGRREDTVDHNDALSLSRFTIPVSVIVPASHDCGRLSHTVAALLGLHYPEFEVIVVVDGVAATALETFSREWQLEAREFFYRQTIDTSPVRRIYRSARDARLVVVDKASNGYADAINCGVNIARYRYTIAVSPEIVFDANALLRIMSAPLRDPAMVLGASNHIEPCGRFERLASARSLMASRVVWRDARKSLGPAAGAVTVWRRDVLLEAKGFSAKVADPDLDMARRVLLSSLAAHGGRFHRGADVFGRRPSASGLHTLGSVGRRHIAALRCVSVLTPSGVRAFGFRSLAAFFESELMTPLAQGWAVAALLIGVAAGTISWGMLIVGLLLLSFGLAAVTAAALLMRGASPGSPDGPELRGLLLAGPVEFLMYWPAVVAAALGAVFRGVRPLVTHADQA
jgi:hypothetical protein